MMWPGFLYLALAPATFTSAATRFDAGHQPLGSVAPLSLTDTDLSGGNVKAYRTWFENGRWQGDLIEYSVSDQGALSTSIDLSGSMPVDGGGAPNSWSANVEFAEAEAADATYPDTRKIITSVGGFQKPFTWTSLSAAQKAALDQAAVDAGDANSIVLEFIRGDRGEEFPSGPLRTRSSILGDLVHSNPVYVAAPRAGYTFGGYADWAEDNKARAPRVYVGANGGMLHAFDAATGKEEWAYVPSMLIPKLNLLTARPYSHQYYVDGLLTVQDIKIGANWTSVLVGGLGPGGKGWFGLDVTDPTMGNLTTDTRILWELDGASDDNLGDAFGQAVIARLNDDEWYAVIGNGYNSVNGKAILYLVRARDGQVTTITTGSGAADDPNGLSSPTVIDRNGDGKGDIVYAGDIDGQLWKFDLSDSNSNNWAVAYGGDPIFPGDPSQPIIQPPDVTRHPVAGYMVMFGTGRLFTSADLDDASVQALYGVWDSGLGPDTDEDGDVDANDVALLEQELSGDIPYSGGGYDEVVQTFVPDKVFDTSTHTGWKVALPAGFRVLQPPQLRGGRLKVTVSHPITRTNYLIEPHFLDGGSPNQPIFDLDRSGLLTSADTVDGNGDADTADSEDIPVMWQRPTGIMSRPTIAQIAHGIDTQLLNFLVPPPGVPCEGECPNGFRGGHINLDTDYFNNASSGTGDGTEQYTFRYDKEVGRVYADYLDLVIPGHAELDDPTYVDPDQEFIVVVANADRSPSSKLTLGNAEYNVVEYQALIQRKLAAWDGIGPLTDDNGNSLIFTANGLIASGGTIRHSFNDVAILKGGLHGTEADCVNILSNVTNDRYRNGALVTQAINRDIFAGGGNPLDKLTIQNPPDLVSPVTLFDGSQVSLKEDLNENGSIEYEAYEVYGGLRAKNTGVGVADGLFESTLYWSYGEKSCYGDGDYQEQLEAKIDALIFEQEEFDELLAALGIEDLAAEILAAQDCKDIPIGEPGACAIPYATLEFLLALEQTIFRDGEVIDNSGLNSNQNGPVPMDGAADPQGVTVGPNFVAGRRTWIDIIAD